MNTYMNLILEQRFFRLLSEYSQRKVSASEFTEAIEELAIHVANWYQRTGLQYFTSLFFLWFTPS